MAISTVRRLAADILGVGQNKIRIKPDSIKEAEGALTRSDVRGLIEKGIVIKLKALGRASTKRVGRRGEGRKRGITLYSKEAWMEKVRAQRKFLDVLVATNAVKKEDKRTVYMKVKSGIFRNKRAMLLYLKDNKLVAADYEPPKPKFEKKAVTLPKKAAPKTSDEAKKAPKPAVEKKGESK